MKKEFWPGGLYAQTSKVDLTPLRPRLVALGREILGDTDDDDEAVRAASGARCYCGRGCTFRCVYLQPRHVGDAVSFLNWPGNRMANCRLASVIGNSVIERNFDVHFDVGSAGGRTFVELSKIANSSRQIAVEPNDSHRELLSVVVPGAEIHPNISGVEPLRGLRCLVTLAGVLNCASSADVTEFVKSISTVGAGSVIATLDFMRAPGRLFEFGTKLKGAFGDAIRLVEFQEDERNIVKVWEVTR